MCVSRICLNGEEFVAKRGAGGSRGLEFKRAFKALTGHRYRVLVHLIIMWAPGGPKMASCLKRCLSGSNFEVQY